MKVAVVLLAVWATALGAPRSASADDRAEAERLFRQGLAAADAGDYAAAATAFERSQLLLPHPGTLKNLATYEQEAGRLADARRSWQELLDRYGGEISASAQREARSRIAALDRLLARASIETSISDAALFVDGRAVGTSPLSEPVWIEPGRHTFEARREGFVDAREIAQTEADRVTAVRLVLAPRPVSAARAGSAPPVVGPASIVPAASPPGRGEAPEPPDRHPSRTASRFWSSPWPWIVGGAVVAGAAVTTAVVLSSSSDEPSGTFRVEVP